MEKSLKNKVVGILRSASVRWPFKTEAMRLARVERGLYKCAGCGSLVKNGQFIMDHIVPCVPLTGWDNFDGFIERLFVPAEGYQLLCLTCDATKTLLEDEMRKLHTLKKNEEKKIQKKLEKQRLKEEKRNGKA